MEYLPNHVHFDPYFDCPEATELITTEQGTPARRLLQAQLDELLTALVLCHHAVGSTRAERPEPSRAPRSAHKSLYKDEESQLQFAESFDYQFMSRRNRLLTILKRSAYARFDEVIIRRIPVGEDALTIQAVKPFQANAAVTIYYRGRLGTLKDFLPKEAARACQADIDRFTAQGIHVYGIGKYELDSEAASDFMRCVSENQAAYKGAKQSKNDRLLMQYAQDMHLIGTWGLKNAVNARDTLVVEELKKNGVKLFMLSQDETAVNLTDCNALEIFEGYSQPLIVQGLTDRQVEESLKTNLKLAVERRTVKAAPDSGFSSPFPGRKGKSRAEANGGKRTAARRAEPQAPTAQEQSATGARKPTRGPAKGDPQGAFSDFSQFAEKNAVFFNGKALHCILKDETLLKLFLTLCSLSSLCVGSSINPYQKATLVRAIRHFSHAGHQGTVISVIGS